MESRFQKVCSILNGKVEKCKPIKKESTIRCDISSTKKIRCLFFASFRRDLPLDLSVAPLYSLTPTFIFLCVTGVCFYNTRPCSHRCPKSLSEKNTNTPNVRDVSHRDNSLTGGKRLEHAKVGRIALVPTGGIEKSIVLLQDVEAS